MNKEMFLTGLCERLSKLPQDEIKEQLAFYSEMIDDRVEDGLSEEAAVAEIGPVDEIAKQIMSEIPLSHLVRTKVSSTHRTASGRSRKTWKTVLLIVGAVVWVPLLIAVLAVLLSLFIAIWAVVISLWAVFLALAASALACIPGAVILLVKGNPLGALAAIGAGLLCAGLAILMYFACLAITRGIARLSKKMVWKVKSLLISKS